ncbi:MAG: ABC transporter permease [Planctomycetales bacterium]|nr:ABC transporter permease [Planctomycetales bacterium]
MFRLLVRRLAALPLVLLGVVAVTFALLHAIPGDPARVVAGDQATAEDVEEARRALGLDRPLPVQFLATCGRLARGDFGRSFESRRPVASDLARTLPLTVELALLATALSVLLGCSLGALAARRPGGALDLAAMAGAGAAAALPVFWLGILLLYAFAVALRWLPAGDWGTPAHRVLPVATLACAGTAGLARMARGSLLSALRLDCVRTARAKGCGEARVLLWHAGRNAALPTVSVAATQFGLLLGGAVLTESVFALPGLGRNVVHALEVRDIPTVQGTILVLATLVLVVNFLADLAYGVLDPRVRA